MVDYRADNIEDFVNGLIKKLVHEAMDTVDATSFKHAQEDHWRRFHVNCTAPRCDDHKNDNTSLPIVQQGDKKLQNTLASQGDQNPSSDIFPRTAIQSNILWTNDGNISFDVDQQASDEIRKIVLGLQSVQIGDSSLVKPATHVPSLEIQVKMAVEEMSNQFQTLENNEVSSIIEGQGDVHDRHFQIEIPATLIETNNEIESSTLEISEVSEKDVNENERQMQRQVQQRMQQEVSKLHSTCFLHRIIKELEDAEANNQENVLKVSSSISGISQERIAAWEENEEKFIRMIDVSKKEESVEIEIDENFAIAPVEEAPNDSVNDVEIKEIKSKPDLSISIPTMHQLPVAPINSDDKYSDIEKESTQQQQQQQQQQHDLNNEKSKIKNKIRIGEKFRRFFRSAFKRGKDC